MKLSIAGGMGRMGKTLLEALAQQPEFVLGAVSVDGQGQAAEAEALLARTGLRGAVTHNTAALVEAADAVIDFTTPAYSLDIARHAALQRKIHLIGTTGFTEAQEAELAQAATQAVIVRSGNFSIGVNVVARLVEQAATLLGPEYDIEISEMHHRHKKDAPSGTALLLGEAAARGRKVEMAQVRTQYGHGETGARPPGAIGFSVKRGGGVIGDHEVAFAGQSELVEITHRSFSRGIYAEGALLAARWAQGKAPGLYSMRDVIGG